MSQCGMWSALTNPPDTDKEATVLVSVQCTYSPPRHNIVAQNVRVPLNTSKAKNKKRVIIMIVIYPQAIIIN